MSDPRLPDDGPSWPERDLEENRADQPAMGWSDDPYPAEPAPPYRPSDEPLEGEWSDSQPFEADPNEPDPFAPDETPRQDDPWGFPPRSEPMAEPAYQPAPTEPEFETAAWDAAAWSQPEPTTEPEPVPETEPEAEAEAEPIAAEQEPELEADAEPEREAEPAQMAAEEAEPAAEADSEPFAAYAAVADAEPESDGLEAADTESEPDSEPDTTAEPSDEPDRSDELVARAAVASVATRAAAGEPGAEPYGAAESEPASEPEAQSEPEPQAELEPPLAAEPDWQPEPVPEPAFEPQREASDEVPVVATAAATAWVGAGDEWDTKRDGNRRRPTTAEQAVPWLIGIILALAGMVIVLLALIFSSPNGLVASDESPSQQPDGSVQPSSSAVAIDPSAGAGGSGEASPSGDESPAATPTAKEPTYGPLEMTYLGRPSAVAPVYLLLRDFSVAEDSDVVAQADEGITSYAAAPNGRVAAAVISERAVALDKNGKTRRLADDITTLTFGWDAETLYAVRVTKDGGNDLAKVLQIDYVSGATKQLATVRYKHPVTGPEAPLKEAQFIDNGGLVRLYAVADGNLTLWVLGAPTTYRIDPANGDITEIARQPILWSPDGTRRVTVHEDGGNTALRLRDRGNQVVASTGVTGLVSHIRWAGSNNEIVFTLGVATSTGGIRQDLYVWDLADRHDPMPLTSTGAAFGAEWRGVMSNWGP